MTTGTELVDGLSQKVLSVTFIFNKYYSKMWCKTLHMMWKMMQICFCVTCPCDSLFRMLHHNDQTWCMSYDNKNST